MDQIQGYHLTEKMGFKDVEPIVVSLILVVYPWQTIGKHPWHIYIKQSLKGIYSTKERNQCMHM